MPGIVRHRVNAVEEVGRCAPGHGAEIDVRSRDGRLILSHDPHRPGDALEDWLERWAGGGSRGTLVLNPKEDGLEGELLAALARWKIMDFFLLDLAMPTLVRLAVKGGERRVAVRVSEYEPEAGALAFAGKVDWVWLDCFSGQPPEAALIASLRRFFRVCLVSPELQGHSKAAIASFRWLEADAVCTKHPELWT